MPIKVAITDDHLIVTDGIKGTLERYEQIEVCGVYGSGQQLLLGLAQNIENIPDVLLLDIQLPDTTGTELVTSILQKYPGIKILILSANESPALIQSLMNEGCKGYLLKGTTNSQMLIDAIEKVNANKLYLEEEIKDRMLENMLGAKRTTWSGGNQLTTREKEVLQLIAAGLNNQQIAAKLFISLRTVENHRYNLLQKLDEKNAVGLVKAAIRLKLI